MSNPLLKGTLGSSGQDPPSRPLSPQVCYLIFTLTGSFLHADMLLINRILQYFGVWKEPLLVLLVDACVLCGGQATFICC